MYFDSLVKIPDVPGKLITKKVKGATYIYYEYERTYDPSRKFNVPKRTTIGKMSDDGTNRMYPNENYLRYFPASSLDVFKEEQRRSSCLKVGSFLVIEQVVHYCRLNQMLGDIFGDEAALLLDLASYSIICEDNAAQYYPDYAYNHPLFTKGMRIYSDSKVSTFFNSIDHWQTSSFLNGWNERRNYRERIYISYDSTNKNCQAGDITMVEFGKAKDEKGLPIFNWALAHDVHNREPLFYEEYPGSIVDVSQLQYMIQKSHAYGYRNIGFILDRGYFSKANIQYMDESGYNFIIMLKGMNKLVTSLIEEHRGSFETKRQCFIKNWVVYAKTVKARLYDSDEKDRYFHIYYSSSKHNAQRSELEATLLRMTKLLQSREGTETSFPSSYEQYFELFYDEGKKRKFLFAKEREEAIEKALELCGYYVIVTSEAMSAKEAIDLYKSRDQHEKLFRGDKSYLGSKSMRVYSDESVHGKIFVEFIALIIRSRIYCLLKDEMESYASKPNYMTVPAALKELGKIEMIRQYDGRYRLDHAVTARQKNILKAFGLDENDVKDKVITLANTLHRGA